MYFYTVRRIRAGLFLMATLRRQRLQNSLKTYTCLLQKMRRCFTLPCYPCSCTKNKEEKK